VSDRWTDHATVTCHNRQNHFRRTLYYHYKVHDYYQLIKYSLYRSRSAIFKLAGKASSRISSILVFLACHKTARRILLRFAAFDSVSGAVGAAVQATYSHVNNLAKHRNLEYIFYTTDHSGARLQNHRVEFRVTFYSMK